MLKRKGVYLNAGLLNGVGLRRQVQYALPDSTGDIQAVNDVLIVVLALTVCACINLLLSGVVVDAGGRAAGCAGPQTRDSGSHGDQGNEVAANDWQLRNALILQGHLESAIGCVDDWRFRADNDGFPE